MMLDWLQVSKTLRELATLPELGWKLGQDDGLQWLADRIGTKKGLLIADEVGLGKTRLAIAVMHAVWLAGGRILAVVPGTILHQWDAEYSRFLKMIDAPEPLVMKAASLQLRHFNDLFRTGHQYPLSGRNRFILSSHRFGIPQKFSSTSKPCTWGLPFIVRSFRRHGLGNWSGAQGLRDNPDIKQLLPAASWLASQQLNLDEPMDALPPLNLNVGAAFSSENGEQARRLRQLLQNLVGCLMGPFDLVVIDEAHRSREDIEDREQISKRLTNLLENVVVQKPGAKRLALTATPVQLAAEDWSKMLQRIGLKGDDLKKREDLIKNFDNICTKYRAGPASDEDVERLCEAAKCFQDALSDLTVRRRWSDQQLMEKARLTFGNGNAHPHRRWNQKVVSWEHLSEFDRMAFLAAEGRAQASRKTSLNLVERHRASRHAQAMDPIDSDGAAYTTNADESHNFMADAPRHAYWVALQNSMRAIHAADGYGGLVRHPRIIEACSWIETVTDRNHGKVLVFANYTQPLVALTQALNVRRFLREVASGTPCLPPLTLRGENIHDNSLVVGVLASMPDRSRIRGAGDLATLISKSKAAYKSASDKLATSLDKIIAKTGIGASERTVIRLAALELMVEGKCEPIDLEAKIAQLAQSLVVAPFEGGKAENASRRELLLETLTAEDGYSTLSRSDFARALYGEGGTASTRHVLQALFNTPAVRPQVLVAQSRVAAEGLNLHEACRHVLFLHLDWNPAMIEQQIGRVDRVGSLWAKEFEKINGKCPPPQIELATIVIEGTSDVERQSRILARQQLLGAHLFGELLPPEITQGLSAEWRGRLKAASPSFSPRRTK